MKVYAGVGSRRTPQNVLKKFTSLAQTLAEKGLALRSGGAIGADTAFEKGAIKANGTMYIYRPYKDRANCIVASNKQFENAMQLVAPLHPVWNYLKPYVKRLMARNAFQILGLNLNDPVDFVVCWTPDGAEKASETSRETGGTGMAIKLADKYNIPVFNFKNKNAEKRLMKFINKLKEATEEENVIEYPY